MFEENIKCRILLLVFLLCSIVHADSKKSFQLVPVPDDTTPKRLNHSYDLITPTDGLPHYRVGEVIQDSLGFLWIISEGGLARFDGYTFKSFHHDPNDPYSLPSNRVWSKVALSTYADSQYLWFRAGGMLNNLNFCTERVTRFPQALPDSLTTTGYATDVAAEGSSVWVTTSKSLDRYDHVGGTFKHYPSGVRLIEVHLDQHGGLWLGSLDSIRKGELLRFDPELQDTIISGKAMNDPNCCFGDGAVEAIIPSVTFGDDYLWIGRCNYEFELLRRSSSTSQYFSRDTTRYPELRGGNCSEVEFESHWITPELWMTSYNLGYSVLDLKTGRLSYDTVFLNNNDGLLTSDVTDLYEDRSGVIWLSTWSGLQRLNRFNKSFETLGTETDGPGEKPVTALYMDSRGRLWYGGHGRIGVMDLRSGSFKTLYDMAPGDPNHFWNNKVNSIQEDRRGEIWSSGHRGIHAIREYGFGLRPELHTPYLNMFDICPDQDGNLWLPGRRSLSVLRMGVDSLEVSQISTRIEVAIHPMAVEGNWILLGGRTLGLVAFDLDTWSEDKWRLKRFKRNYQDITSLSNNRVYTLYESSDSVLWVGTAAGLDYVSLKDGLLDSLEFGHITIEDGLPDPNVLSIIEDKKGRIWIATQNGLSRLDRETWNIHSYDEGDGLASACFLPGACTIDSSGRLYFGSMAGLISFHPDSLHENPVIPSIVLTDLRILHQEVPILPRTQSDQAGVFSIPASITYLDTLYLSYEENIFTLEFAALDYRNPMKNQYAYKLEGFEDDWIYTDATNRQVTYTNLDPGEYVFWVKGSNNDGLWNEEGRSLVIIITPPWWQTNWVYASYILLGIALLTGLWLLQLNRIKVQHQMEMEHASAERYKELDELKTRFFANISHEFRTPLTLILGPIEKWYNRVKEKELRDDLTMMQKHSRRVLELVTQLLDLSKLDAGKMELQASERNVVPLLKGLVLSFASLAERQDITLSFHSDLEEIRAHVEKESLVKIMNNLLSNAFKFTPDGGIVKVRVNLVSVSDLGPDGELRIQIEDTGAGIAEDSLQTIFDRFVQADSSITRQHEGSGIGLALTKELVELHSGCIHVDSVEGEGTQFIIALPLGRSHLSPEQIVEIDTDEVSIPEQGALESEGSTAEPPGIGIAKAMILIVEDNSDVRQYVRSYLDRDYRCFEALDGLDGLHQARKRIPDLIISDIMMPRMDGVELCQKLKQDERTSHIPVILLTARADMQSKLEGLEIGADDYLTKPFESTELLVRVTNIISQRKRLRDHFQKELNVIPANLDLSTTDEQFLQKALDLANQHLDDEDFTVEKYAKLMHMTRQNLSRKLRSLTGSNAVTFIRQIRLKRAALMLQRGEANIAEIAFKVGFSSVSYFSKTFKSEFGMPPKQYSTHLNEQS